MDSICLWTCEGLPVMRLLTTVSAAALWARSHLSGVDGAVWRLYAGHRLPWCRASITDSRDSGVSPVLSCVTYYLAPSTRNLQASPVHVLHNYPKNAIKFYFITARVLRRHQFRAISSVLSCLSALYKCTLYNSRQHNYLNNLYSWLGIGADEQKASSLSTVNAFSGGLWLLSNASRRPNVSCRMSTATVLVKLRTSAWTRNVSCSLRLNS